MQQYFTYVKLFIIYNTIFDSTSGNHPKQRNPMFQSITPYIVRHFPLFLFNDMRKTTSCFLEKFLREERPLSLPNRDYHTILRQKSTFMLKCLSKKKRFLEI